MVRKDMCLVDIRAMTGGTNGSFTSRHNRHLGNPKWAYSLQRLELFRNFAEADNKLEFEQHAKSFQVSQSNSMHCVVD